MYRGGSRMPYDAQGTLPASPTMAATTCPRRTATISDASTSAEITRASLGRRTRTGSTWDAGERGGTARFCRVGCAMPEHKTGQSQRPIRVAHIVFDLHGGGMESLVAEMAKRFARSSVAMSVITLSGRVGRVGRAVRPLVDQFHVLKPLPGISMVAPLGLVRCLRRIRPDVVHLHSGAWYKGALAARLARVPRIVYTEHGREHYDPRRARWLDRWASKWTDVVIAVSDGLRRYLEVALHIPPD